MKKDTLELLLLLIGVLTPVAAFVVFWVGKLLNLRDEIKELQMNAGFDRQKISKLEERVEDLEDKWDRVG